MALRQDVEIFRGTDVTFRVTLSPVPTGGIAGWEFEMTARENATDADPASIQKVNASFTIEDADLAIFSVDIADTDTTGLTAGDYAYDIKRMTDGSEGILVYGTLTLLQEVTR